MEALDHMLTDPLEPVMSGDQLGPGLMEECLLGGTRICLPEDLLEDPEIFFDVLSSKTWDEVLTASQKEHLRKFLPHFSENNLEQQNQTIAALFSGENFRFGNPLQVAQKLFRDGYFNPEVVKYRQLCFKSHYKRYLQSQQQHCYQLLKQLLVSRKELLDLARKSGPDLVVKRTYPPPLCQLEEKERRTQRRYLKIVRDVKEECGDSALSSDEEDLCSWLPRSPSHPPSPAIPLRLVPSLSTQDMKTVDKLELKEIDLKLMLKHHREKRKRQPDHPDLATSELTLTDIMSRVNAGRKGSLAALFDLAVPKKKVKEKEEKKKKKLKVIKTEPEDLPELLATPEVIPELPPEPPVPPLTPVKEEPAEEIKPVPVGENASCFFSLLQEILLQEGHTTLLTVEERVQEWSPLYATW